MTRSDVSFLDQLQRQFNRWQLSPGTVVVAVSGGPDSVALLRGLHAVCSGARWQLMAAHVNHQLRESSDLDEAFVRNLCQSSKIELHVERVDVRQVKDQQGEGIEMAARTVRYDYLQRLATKYKASYIATGHTADDQVETILHRILRGTGLRGLSGIPDMRALDASCELIRPMLRITREEVIRFLEKESQDFMTDHTNYQIEYTRNRIRHDLLPKLRSEYNPQIARALLNLASQSESAFETLEIQARHILENAIKARTTTSCMMDTDVLRCQSSYLLNTCFQLLWETQFWPQRDMGFEQWQRLSRLARNRPSGAEPSAISLPGEIDARRKGAFLIIRSDKNRVRRKSNR